MKTKRMPLETRRPVSRPKTFPPRRDYSSLSIKDLLDAREAYHVYLSTLDNVVATAIGRYLIHEKDWFAKHAPDRARPADFPRVTEPRTLTNSVIRPWSWPAVLVFVRKWADAAELSANAVPRSLYLPDGRVVPTCVVQAAPDESLPPPARGPAFNSSMVGGGYSCMRRHQGEQSLGTFACLIRKGGSYYALTNRHVAGGDGEEVNAYIRGEYRRVGIASNIAVDRLLMSAAFPNWAGSHTYLNLDAGLVRVDDIRDWTSQAFGIGEIGEMFDATEQSLTLDLIGVPLRAFGGSSGVAEGEIRALFFRYESLGGYDYATDVLIGPRTDGRKINFDRPLTGPGDSGTLWFYDPPREIEQPATSADFENRAAGPERGLRARRLRPVAMQWGGQRFILPNGSQSSFALGSFLSTICRSLDVELVRNWSTGHDEYWGKIGHFSIGWKACDQLSGPLAQLMQANQARIGFDDATISSGSGFRVGRKGFVPLADVPDYVWVSMPGVRPSEGIQHFADIDIEDIDGGPPLLERCHQDPANISAKVWKDYFDGFAAKEVGPEEGCLPFRVWQIWEAMVEYLQQGDVLRFVAAGGVMAHYVGDASQPLHCSYLHHGQPPMLTVDGREYPVPRDSDAFKQFKTTPASKIHGIYEENMLEVDTATALAAVDDILRNANGGPPEVKSGHEAAISVIRLMHDAQERLSPQDIIDADDPESGPSARARALWNNQKVRNATIQSLADSVQVLASLWTSAWKAGKGSKIDKSKLVEFQEDELDRIYRRDRKFVPSLSLDEMAQSGKFEP
ncbi:MAG TPA: hypothetical protein VLT16_05880 [Candidatus Limnocylindrales bacterium]|nr:hypothetical protein [Candidatus Limnocylindrales bacterium]